MKTLVYHMQSFVFIYIYLLVVSVTWPSQYIYIHLCSLYTHIPKKGSGCISATSAHHQPEMIDLNQSRLRVHEHQAGVHREPKRCVRSWNVGHYKYGKHCLILINTWYPQTSQKEISRISNWLFCCTGKSRTWITPQQSLDPAVGEVLAQPGFRDLNSFEVRCFFLYSSGASLEHLPDS